MKVVATVKDGAIRLPKEWEGKRVFVEEIGKTRSLRANAYYWGVVVGMTSEHTGHSSDEMHAIFKTKFLKRTVPLKGIMVNVVGSTAGLKTGEFQEYVMKCERWASEQLDMVFPTREQYEESMLTVPL